MKKSNYWCETGNKNVFEECLASINKCIKSGQRATFILSRVLVVFMQPSCLIVVTSPPPLPLCRHDKNSRGLLHNAKINYRQSFLGWANACAHEFVSVQSAVCIRYTEKTIVFILMVYLQHVFQECPAFLKMTWQESKAHLPLLPLLMWHKYAPLCK